MQKTRKRKPESDDLRKKDVEIRFLDGPLKGTYYVRKASAYYCLPNINVSSLLQHDDIGLDAEEWLYYRNTGQSASKHKNRGVEYKLSHVEREPDQPTVSNPFNCAIAAAKAGWRRREDMLKEFS